MTRHNEKKVTVHFDGACEPINPGGEARWAFVVHEGGKTIHSASGVIASGSGASSNLAEYGGLYYALKWLTEQNLHDYPIEIYGDSALVINQMSGRWKVRAGLYVHMVKITKELLKKFKAVQLQWIPREENSEADELTRMGQVLRPSA